MNRATLSHCLSALVLAISINMHSSASIAQSAYDPVARVKDAHDLLNGNNTFLKKSQELHAKIQESIKVAQVLQGHATDLDIQIDRAKLQPRLTGAQLKAAQGIYDNDLKVFQAHAQSYANHLQQFRATVGDCSSNAKLYQELVKRYSLHTEAFHLPDIVPPHVCGQLQASELISNGMAGQIADDQARLLKSEGDLNAAETKLNADIARVGGVRAKVLMENTREAEEKVLLKQFGSLKKEYDNLQVEHTALVASGHKPKASSKSVSAKLIHK